MSRLVLFILIKLCPTHVWHIGVSWLWFYSQSFCFSTEENPILVSRNKFVRYSFLLCWNILKWFFFSDWAIHMYFYLPCPLSSLRYRGESIELGYSNLTLMYLKYVFFTYLINILSKKYVFVSKSYSLFLWKQDFRFLLFFKIDNEYVDELIGLQSFGKLK